MGRPQRGAWVQTQLRERIDSRVVSASSSFLRFIRSLRASASRRAIWIFCWIDSAFASAMPRGQSQRRNAALER